MVAPFHLLGCSQVCVYKKDKSIAPKQPPPFKPSITPMLLCIHWMERMPSAHKAKYYRPSLCVQTLSCEARVSAGKEPQSLGSCSAAIFNVNKMLPSTSPTRCPQNIVSKWEASCFLLLWQAFGNTSKDESSWETHRFYILPRPVFWEPQIKCYLNVFYYLLIIRIFRVTAEYFHCALL